MRSYTKRADARSGGAGMASSSRKPSAPPYRRVIPVLPAETVRRWLHDEPAPGGQIRSGYEDVVAAARALPDARHRSVTASARGAASADPGALRRAPAPVMPARVTIGEPTDPCEREADHVAERVLAAPVPALAGPADTADAGTEPGLEPMVGRQPTEAPDPSAEVVDGQLGPSIDALRSGGEPLPDPARDFFEPRLGHDLGNVRVHTGPQAATTAHALGARAYTLGRDIVFGEGQYAPSTQGGKRLLAHELAHVVQQAGSTPVVQRDRDHGSKDKEKEKEKEKEKKRVPADLLTPVKLGKLSEADLIERYEQLNQWYAVKGLSKGENAALKKGIGDIGGELTRRSQAAGRTFAVEDVEKMKQYFMATVDRRRQITDEKGEKAAEKEFQCINVLRAGMTKLFGDSTGLTMTKDNTMEQTMDQLHDAGRASQEHIIRFSSKNDKPIGRGSGARPDHLETSVWDYLIADVKKHGDIGLSVYGLSLMDGLHSVTLTVDYREPKNPTVRFTDHTLHHGTGWEGMKREASGHVGEYQADSPRGLDEYITYFIQVNWDDQDEGAKHTPWIRLWRLRRPMPAPPPPRPR